MLTTFRNTEVVSDLTNVLALEAASRKRRSGDLTVHLAACHDVLRMQPFQPPYSQHFRLFALVSTARDTGGGSAEAGLMSDHLRFWADALPQVAPDTEFRLDLTAFDSPVLQERLIDTVLPDLQPLAATVTARVDEHREQGRGYYTSAALRITATKADATLELGDGGLTDWSAKLLANAKERLLISCISTERLAACAPGGSGGPIARRTAS